MIIKKIVLRIDADPTEDLMIQKDIHIFQATETGKSFTLYWDRNGEVEKYPIRRIRKEKLNLVSCNNWGLNVEISGWTDEEHENEINQGIINQMEEELNKRFNIIAGQIETFIRWRNEQ